MDILLQENLSLNRQLLIQKMYKSSGNATKKLESCKTGLIWTDDQMIKTERTEDKENRRLEKRCPI